MGQEFEQSVIDPEKRQALIDSGINPAVIVREKTPKDQIETVFETGKNSGADGYVDPSVWNDLKAQFISAEGDAMSFDSAYASYKNPKDQSYN